jgi:hypothetical protein
MRFLLALLVAGTFVGVTAVASAVTTHDTKLSAAALRAKTCGVERWPAKTLADPGSAQIKLRARAGTVAKLAGFPVHIGLGGIRGLGVERRVYRLKVRVLSVKQEDDLDFHVVIADPVGDQTMIVEFANPSCALGTLPTVRKRMARARSAFVTACGLPGSSRFQKLHGTATVTGAGFFDRLHHQSGVAPNGIELHPVLTFSGHCD